MTQVKPFRAVVYNQDKIADLSKVVCPPYDVISEPEQEAFLKKDTHNFIRLILGKILPTDNDRENRYTRAKKSFEEWLEEGILKKEIKPAVYFYLQEYVIQGEKRKRLGFIALMRLEDEKSMVFSHENTHSAPKQDRLELLKAVEANLSPIFVLYSDKERNIKIISETILAKTRPDMDITDEEKIRHRLWAVEDEEAAKKLSASLNDKQIFIADGHHRYEVALNFRKLMLANGQQINPEADYNFILTYFTNLDSPDLLILPFHRIVKDFPENLDFLEDNFRVEKIKNKHDLLVALAKAGRNEHAFGLYQQGKIFLLRLKSERLADSLIGEGSAAYKRLDVTILKHLVFDPLGIVSKDLIYTQDAQEAIGRVEKKEAKACFLLNPVRIEQLRLIALNNERMPPKSTYFYPKVLSGMVVNKLDL